jgi:hypothetical protein
MTDEHDVRRIALSLPDAVEDGELSFRVHGRQFAWMYPERIHPKKPRVPRRDIFVILAADEADKLALIEGEPDAFFTVPHYDGTAMVMVRLDAVDEARLAELLADSLTAAIAKGPIRKRSSR